MGSDHIFEEEWSARARGAAVRNPKRREGIQGTICSKGIEAFLGEQRVENRERKRADLKTISDIEFLFVLPYIRCENLGILLEFA